MSAETPKWVDLCGGKVPHHKHHDCGDFCGLPAHHDGPHRCGWDIEEEARQAARQPCSACAANGAVWTPGCERKKAAH